jgi:hypothetical protein
MAPTIGDHIIFFNRLFFFVLYSGLMEGQCQEENDRSSELLGGCDRIQVADTPLAKASPNARGAEVGSENCALRGQG